MPAEYYTQRCPVEVRDLAARLGELIEAESGPGRRVKRPEAIAIALVEAIERRERPVKKKTTAAKPAKPGRKAK